VVGAASILNTVRTVRVMKKSGGLFNLFSWQRRKPRSRQADRLSSAPSAPSTVTPIVASKAVASKAVASKRDRRTRESVLAEKRAGSERSKPKRGFLGFLPKLGRSKKVSVSAGLSGPSGSNARVRSVPPVQPIKASRTAPQKKGSARQTDRVVNFPQKPARSSLDELRARRQDRAPRRHALFTPPLNPIKLPRPRNRPETMLLYAVRMLILGVGLGVISGTVLSVWDPTSRLTAGANLAAETKPEKVVEEVPLRLDQEMATLKTQIQALTAKSPTLSPSVMLVDLDSHAYVDVAGSDVVAAASTIKLPLLIAFFQDVDQGRVQLDQPIAMRKELIATEAGEMQYQPVGSKFSAIKTVTEMITASDNTASNMTIDLLGGIDSLNQRFKSWGLTGTMIRNPLPDVAGTNTTSARDMAQMLSQLSEGKLVSNKSRDRIFDLMRRVQYNTLLPKGLGEGSTIAHKTGTIGTMLADVGLIDTSTGQRYVAAVLVKRPKDDERADELIQQISKLGYQAFNQQQAVVPKELPKEGETTGRSRIAQP
jgi:beta-lactamase class A